MSDNYSLLEKSDSIYRKNCGFIYNSWFSLEARLVAMPVVVHFLFSICTFNMYSHGF